MNTFELAGSVGNGTYTSSTGQWYQGGTISNITTGSSPTTVTTTLNHGLTTGDLVSLINLAAAGITANADIIRQVTVTAVNTFTFSGSLSGAYTSGAYWAMADYNLDITWKIPYVL